MKLFLLSLFWSPLLATAQKTLFNFTLTSLSEIKQGFSAQYSYEKPSWSAEYMAPALDGLLLSIYPKDNPHTSTSNTLPRTELRLRQTLKEDIAYSFQIQQYITSEYNFSYEFCFLQMFGSTGPNTLLRWRNGAIQLVTRSGNFRANASVVPVINSWVTWRMDFNLTKDKTGYTKVYRNNQLVISFVGPSFAGGVLIPKFGIYSQTWPITKAVRIRYRNFIISQLNAPAQQPSPSPTSNPTPSPSTMTPKPSPKPSSPSICSCI